MARRKAGPPRALVLGGTGFIGSALMGELRRRGVEARGFGSKTLDLSDPRAVAGLRRLIDARTTVFLLSRARYGGNPWAGFAKDAAILANAAAALRARAARKWVFLGSTAIFGASRTNRRIREDAPVTPESPYAAAKAMGELLLGGAAAAGGVPLLVLRPPMVYGPGDPGTAYGPGRLIRSLLEDGEMRLFGDGGELRDFLFIEDLARIAVDLALGPRSGAFNVAGGPPATFAALARSLKRLAGEGKVVHDPRRIAKTDQVLDASKLRRALPRARFTPLARGLETTYRASEAAR